MDTGRVIKIIKNVPAPIPVSIPKKKSHTTPDKVEKIGLPLTTPLTPKREKVGVEK